MSNGELYAYPPAFTPPQWRFENYAETLRSFEYLTFLNSGKGYRLYEYEAQKDAYVDKSLMIQTVYHYFLIAMALPDCPTLIDRKTGPVIKESQRCCRSSGSSFVFTAFFSEAVKASCLCFVKETYL